jgi:putative transcriptional regulator
VRTIAELATMNSYEGHLLVASPHLLDPNFVKTVVLLVQHSDQGALGVVINRPISKTVKELWSEVGDAPCESGQPVFLGGPVPGPLMAIHADASLAELEILPGLFFAAKKAHLDRLVGRGDQPFRIFVGHAGWGPGQLEHELQEGAWLTTPATADCVFRDPEDLWAEVSKHVGESLLQTMLKIKHLPPDPSMN